MTNDDVTLVFARVPEIENPKSNVDEPKGNVHEGE